MKLSENGAHREFDRRAVLRAGAAIAAGGVTFPLLSACGSSGSAAAGTASKGSGTKTVSVRFNWTIKGEFTPFFVAREKGYYDKEGINVKLLEGKSGTQAVQVVGSGQDSFGYVPSIQVVEGINKDVPITAIGTMGRYTGMCWGAWPNVPLTGPTSLYGHKVSISTSSTFFQVWPGFQRKFHLDTSRIEVEHPDPSSRKGLFLRHNLDIMADIFYANDWVILEQKAKPQLHGNKLNLLRMSKLGFDPLGYLIVANKSMLSGANVDTTKKFMKATLQGFQYTLSNPDDAVNIMTKLYGDRLSKAVFSGQIHNMKGLLIQKPGLGHGTDSVWQDSLGILSQSGILKKTLPLNKYYTNEYLR